MNFNQRTVLYVFDAYCGWCWGFSERVREFEIANRHRVAFMTISGGLFTANRIGPISRLTYVPEANAKITKLTGAQFGQPFQEVFAEGSFEMNSDDAGAAMAALRAQSPEQSVHWAHLLQEAFYKQGLSLSDPNNIAAIASAHGLDERQVLASLADGSAKLQAEADFALSRGLGVSSYPTLLYIDGSKVHKLPGTGTPLSTLNSELDALLA